MDKRQWILLVALALFAGGVGGVLAGRIFFEAPTVPREDEGLKKVVLAEEFHLVDAEGRDRWVLNLSKNGEPTITFINKNGWAPMALGINKGGLPFFNMVLEPSKEGGPSLILMDSEMKNRALLGLDKDGGPYLNLLDQDGQIRVAVGCSEIANPLTGLKERKPCSSIILFDEAGKVLWSAPGLAPIPVRFSLKEGDGSGEGHEKRR